MPSIQLSAPTLRLVGFHLLLCLSLATCKSPERTETAAPNIPKPGKLQLVDKGTKSLTVGEFVNTDNLLSLQVKRINATDYLSYYDYQTHALYLHDYASGALKKTVQLKKEGPDKVITFISPQFYIHSLDSIYINTDFSGYFLVDGTGKVLSNANKRASGFRSDDIDVRFDASSYLSRSGVTGSIKWNSKKLVEQFALIQGTLNFENGEIVTSPIHASDIFDDYEAIMAFLKRAKKEKKLYRFFQLQSNYHSGNLYLTTNINDSISLFRNDKLVKRIYAGMPAHTVTDYLTFLKNGEIIMGKGEVRAKKVLNKPAFYEQTLLDPAGKFIYRVLVHGTKPGISPYDGSEIPVITGATLIAIDLETEQKYDFELPIEDIQVGGSPFAKAFVSSEGIHFRVKEQDIEDEVQYEVYGFSQ